MTNLFNNYQSPTSINDRVLIVDALNSWLRVWSSIPLISENGEHIGGIVGFLRSIGVNIRDFNPTRCLIVFDGKGGLQSHIDPSSNQSLRRAAGDDVA